MNREFVWGLTKKADIVHAFRNSRTICPSKNGCHSWLFVPKPDWNPDDPAHRKLTCKHCLCILQFEERESQECQVSHVSPVS